MFSGTIPFSSESKLSQFTFLFLLLSLYLCGNTDHFTTKFPLQVLPHPEHWNLDFTLIPPSHEVTSFSAFWLTSLFNQLAPFLHQPAICSPLSFWDALCYLRLSPVITFLPQGKVQDKMCLAGFLGSQLPCLLCSFLVFPQLKAIASF